MIGFGRDDDTSFVWIAHALGGPAFAASMELDALGFDITAAPFMRLVRGTARMALSPSFVALRDVLSRASLADYHAARDLFAPAFAALAPVPRAAAAFMFPEEPWAKDELRALLDDPAAVPRAWERAPLLSPCHDRDLVSRFMAIERHWSLAFLPDLAVALPSNEIAEFVVGVALRAEEGKTTGSSDWMTIAETLASIVDERVARVLARLLVHKFVGPPAVAYFRRHAELARMVLPPVALAKTKNVVFDEMLSPVVVVADGSRAKLLPRPSASDDKAKAKDAGLRFKALKVDALAIAQNQIRRLENAMVRGRRWTASDFEALLVRHPLLGHLVRRLVWGVFEGDVLRRTFRVAEDGTHADASDRVLAPTIDSESSQVGIAHPLLLDEASRARWIGVFGDYEILQPFEQLGRTMPTLVEEERATPRSKRFHGANAKAGAILGTLDARGWDRIQDSWVASYSREVRTKSYAAKARLTITFGPGFSLDDVKNAPPQVLEELVVTGAETLGDVHPIDLAESLRDLEALRR
ncbi:hypothetical protein BH09MYX1_BH09MYX1_04130 [soil metagenome]